MNEQLRKKIIKTIEGNPILVEPRFINSNDDGTTTCTFYDRITVDGVTYDYVIEWTGVDNGEDEGLWSEPYDIKVVQ